MTNKAIFDELLQNKFVLAFINENLEFNKLYNILEDPVLLNLSVSDELRERFISELGITHLPVVIHKKCPIYSEDDFEEKFDEINLNYYENFINDFTSKAKLGIIIKGTIEKPYCKYTKQLVSIIKERNITDVIEFNIFDDELMRFYLKKINSWDTYPMIYINSKFLGGLDVFKEYIIKTSL